MFAQEPQVPGLCRRRYGHLWHLVFNDLFGFKRTQLVGELLEVVAVPARERRVVKAVVAQERRHRR